MTEVDRAERLRRVGAGFRGGAGPEKLEHVRACLIQGHIAFPHVMLSPITCLLTKRSAHSLYRLQLLAHKYRPVLGVATQQTPRLSLAQPLHLSRAMSSETKTKSEGEWQAILSPEQFRILRQKGTEQGKQFMSVRYHTCSSSYP